MADRTLSEVLQTADWKNEKHVPVIECPDSVGSGSEFNVTVTLGKAIAHPNTTEHHIRWMELHFLPDGAKQSFQIGHFDFSAHGESKEGPNQGPVYTAHEVVAKMKTTASGTLMAMAYCNIHGLWQNAKALKIG